MNWREARVEAGLSMDDALHQWRSLDLPTSIAREVSRSKLGRLETGKNAHLSVVAQKCLAGIYGQPLSAIDEGADLEYEMIISGGPDLGKQSLTWTTAESGEPHFAVIDQAA